MSNVIQFRARAPRIETPIPLYRLSVRRAKALGMCPDAANDTRRSGSPVKRRRVTAEHGKSVDDALASLLELSIQALVASGTASLRPTAPDV